MKKIFRNKKLSIWLIIAITIVIWFCVSIFSTFKTVLYYTTRIAEYKEARTYMTIASVINEEYIFPLSVRFGCDNLIIKPFYWMSDKFFDAGYSKFPKDEGEKEFWWYKIKFNEYEQQLLAWRISEKLPSYSTFIKVDNELYKHIDLFASAKITNKSDKLFAIQKLTQFVRLAKMYVDSNDILKSKFESDNQAKLGIKGMESVLPPEDIKRYEHVYNTYINLLNYSKIHEKESYNYFYSDPVYWLGGDVMVYYLVDDILKSKLYTNKLDCNDKFIKIFTDEHRKIREFYYKNEKNKNMEFSLHGAYTPTFYAELILAYKCQNNPYMKEYIKYIYSLDNYKNDKTLENSKNLIIKEYIREKQYGRLKQLQSIGIK